MGKDLYSHVVHRYWRDFISRISKIQVYFIFFLTNQNGIYCSKEDKFTPHKVF